VALQSWGHHELASLDIMEEAQAKSVTKIRKMRGLCKWKQSLHESTEMYF
jgi:hypothetical protein